jgi:hypothetical protein
MNGRTVEEQMSKTIDIYERQTKGMDWDGTKLEDK